MIQLGPFTILKKEKFQAEINSRLRTALYEFIDNVFSTQTDDDLIVRSDLTTKDMKELVLKMTSKPRKLRANKRR